MVSSLTPIFPRLRERSACRLERCCALDGCDREADEFAREGVHYADADGNLRGLLSLDLHLSSVPFVIQICYNVDCFYKQTVRSLTYC